MITDANECKIAAFAILGIATADLTIATAGVTTDSTSGKPYGCYYETIGTNSGKVFLGTATGTGCHFLSPLHISDCMCWAWCFQSGVDSATSGDEGY